MSITFNILSDTEITPCQLATLAREHLIDWNDIAPELGINPAQIFAIQQIPNFNGQKREALNTWKRNKGNGATFRAFITAADSIGNTDLVHRVKKWLEQLQGIY